MNLFWKKLFRLLQPTSVFEQKLETIQFTSDDYESENLLSDERIKDEIELETYLKSDDFQLKKKLYQTKKYKDTDECRILRQFEKLQNDNAIRLYFETKQSDLLDQYLKFKSEPDSLGLKNLSISEMSDVIEKLKQFEQSKEYKNYSQYHNSLIIREFEELKEKISSAEFQQNNAFWANPNRWETTREFYLEQQYLESKGEKSETTKKKNKLFFLKKYASVYLNFKEDFYWKNLEESRWSAGFHSKNSRFVGNYSFVNERQANNEGRNVSVENGILTIHTVEIPSKSLAWDLQRGFVEHKFDFLSDVIQTSNTFKQKYGVFCAKIRCSGEVHHAVWLKNDKKLPHINLFHFDGENITMGNAGQHKMDQVALRGIDENNFFIYSVEWTPKSLVWYVNNVEVHRTNENIPHESLYFGINSFIPKSKNGTTGKLEIEWIRAFKVRE